MQISKFLCTVYRLPLSQFQKKKPLTTFFSYARGAICSEKRSVNQYLPFIFDIFSCICLDLE